MSVSAFGNPLVEQRDLLAGKSSVALPVKVIRVTGADRLTWLHALLSQNIVNLKPGESCEALLLDPQGHIEASLHVVDDSVTTTLIVDESRAEAVLAHLTKMKLRTKVEISLENELQVFGSFGAPLQDAEIVWHDPWPGVYPGGHRYAANSGGEWNYFESVGGTPLEPAGLAAFTAIRIFAHRPAIVDVDDKTLPHELDWLTTGVHLSKGCYRGQEAVAKVHNLGHPPRRLVLLHLDGSEHLLPKDGAKVYLGEVEVGQVTSAATHFEAGAIALAVIKRGTNPEVELVVEGNIAASQELIVPLDAGKAVTIPRRSLLGSRK